MTTLTESKVVYEEFKYFKNIYTKINFAEKIQLKGDKDNKRVIIQFLDVSSFTYFTGYLYDDTEFLKWLKDGNKIVTGVFQHFIEIAKTLKKNAEKIEYDSNFFSFKYKKKSGENLIDSTLMLIPETDDKTSDIVDMEFNKEFKIDETFLKGDVLQVYYENEELTQTRTTDKIIEIPKEKIYSLLKDETLFLAFTVTDEIGSRIVRLRSKSDSLGIELIQYFRTI